MQCMYPYMQETVSLNGNLASQTVPRARCARGSPGLSVLNLAPECTSSDGSSGFERFLHTFHQAA